MPIYKHCDYCHARLRLGETCRCRSQRKAKDKTTDDFYLSKQWRKARAKCISNCYGLDVYALYKHSRIEYGATVHHIQPLNDHPELATEQSNLIYLSDKNHAEIHEQYKSNYDDALKKLHEYKNKFAGEYKPGGIQKCFSLEK